MALSGIEEISILGHGIIMSTRRLLIYLHWRQYTKTLFSGQSKNQEKLYKIRFKISL